MKYLFLCALILGQQTLYAQTTLSPEIRSYIDTQIAKQNSNNKASENKGEFMFGGYFRAGTRAYTSGGTKNAGSCYSLNYPKNDGHYYRLGNSCRDYGEFNLGYSKDVNGLIFRTYFMLDVGTDSRGPTETENWSRRVRNMYIELDNLFDNSTRLWMGRRYYRSIGGIGDLHMVDAFHVQSSGNGFGFSDIPVTTNGHLYLAFLGYGYEDKDTNTNAQNAMFDSRYNHKLGEDSIQIAMQNVFIHDTDSGEDLTEGNTLTLQYQPNWGMLKQKIGLQIGNGSMAKNLGCFGTDGNCFDYTAKKSAKATRLYDNGFIDFSADFKMNYLVFIEESSEYHRLSSVGIRPHYVLAKYWSLLMEISYDDYELKNKAHQSLNKNTIALQATPNAKEYWQRPALRFYLSHFKWNQAATTISNLSSPDSNTNEAIMMGVNAEIWY